ncbi:polysaccharide deacetylase [Desulfosporosinus acididurans]|uniref:Polysaccharide deacetylase n=1 Tax=Desulfosporosinus acididurans TaxID=476652 RepID=A0A0J1FS62_9FIRM|nr:polysaccharide deacetylase family protein [Desulfosporosinus acididurans]KLU66127.1 polysaccharide deacetylase [Desulfosporosinus acididurans]
MKLAFSWDDGAPEDKRLFELHEKYEIPGMFFVPTRNREGRTVITPEMMRNAESQYVSFGGHTENHTYLTSIPIEDVDEEVKANQEYLENILGHEVCDFCLPGGKYNEEILKIVYRYYKTVRTADTMNFNYSGGVLKPAIHFYPRGFKSLFGNAWRNRSYSELIFLLTHPTNDYFQLVNKIIEKASKKNDNVLMIWGHSWELEKFELWDELENLFTTIQNNFKEKSLHYADMYEVK